VYLQLLEEIQLYIYTECFLFELIYELVNVKINFVRMHSSLRTVNVCLYNKNDNSISIFSFFLCLKLIFILQKISVNVVIQY